MKFLLVVLFVVLFPLACCQRQHETGMEPKTVAIRFIKQLGGSVFDTDGAPPIFRKGLGNEFGNAFFVDLSKTPVTDEDLELLRPLQPIASLSINDTAISDKGLAAIAEMGKIRQLEISGTVVSDEGCKALGGMKSLCVLYVSHTRISDNGLRAICDNCPEIHTLDLYQTKVSDEGIRNLGKLRKLKKVDMGKCKITNKGLECLEELPNLEVLWLNETAVGPGIGGTLRACSSKRLRDISLKGTHTKDEDLWYIKNIASITQLDLSETDVTDKGIVQLVALKKLIGLPLAGTKVTGAARAILAKHNPAIRFSSLPYEGGK